MSTRRKLKAMFPCADCGTPTSWADRPHEYYMVYDCVWEAAGMQTGVGVGMDEFLCIGCLERRLGRELTAADFTDCFVNRPGPGNTARLNARLTGP